MLWAQEQAGTGVLAFPAIRDGKGRPFEVAEVFYHRAEQDGTLQQVIRNGWSVEVFGDGGLQFDNGLVGVALMHFTNVRATRNASTQQIELLNGRPVVGS